MKTPIKAAFVAPTNSIPTDTVQLSEQNNIFLSPFLQLDELKNSDYFDVVLLHESQLEELRKMSKAFTTVIVLAGEMTSLADLLPRISDIAYYTVLQKPVSAETVVQQIRNAFDEARQKKIAEVQKNTKGKTIAITSFTNGVGKTLIAYNLAHKLGLFFPEDTISLTDMNAPLSNAKAMINFEEEYSWNTIRPILKEGLVSQAKLGNIVYPTPYRFQLLGGAVSYAENAALSDRELTNLVQSLNDLYSINILDLPTIGNKDFMKRLEPADIILVVLDSGSASILQTRRGLEMMHEHYPELTDKVKFIVNRVDASHGKTAALIASRFGFDVFSAIDDDPEAVRIYQDTGKLFQDKTLLIDTQLYNIAEKLIRVVL